jgi:hypothetical protein
MSKKGILLVDSDTLNARFHSNSFVKNLYFSN